MSQKRPTYTIREFEPSEDFSNSENEDKLSPMPPSRSLDDNGKVSFSDIAKKIQSDPKPKSVSGAGVSAKRLMGGSSDAADHALAGSKKDSSTLAQDTSVSASRRLQLRTISSGRSLLSADTINSDLKGANETKLKPSQARTPMPRPHAVRAGKADNKTNRTPTSSSNDGANTKRANLLASRLKGRATAVKTRLGNERRAANAAGANNDLTLGETTIGSEKTGAVRRYKPGDNVLVCNQQSRWSTLVNRYGFPPGEGATPEEMRGPYIYALATVRQVHFEEFAAYYTVTRADTGAEQRADTDFMEPIRTTRGEQAAYRAAMQSSLEGGADDDDQFVIRENEDDEGKRNKFIACVENVCFFSLLPFLWIWDWIYYLAVTFLAPIWRFLKNQARKVLMGVEPYACQLRLTMVNFIVICSFWFMFIDQARLAFFPPEADKAVAIINFIIWLILIAELGFEVFIRPDGYQNLIISEKAFAPQTVRYINMFHLVVESLCLALFVPEFICLFLKDSCSDRLSFSFYNAALMAVTGPTRVEAVYGRAYFALVRLRVFGLVRHWKNMWIINTFLHKRKSENGLLSNIFPQRAKAKVAPSKQSKMDDAQDDPESGPQKQQSKDATLVNASNIGTALMVTNSYRAIALLCVITGIFPIFGLALNENFVNNVADSMTEQLQATNLIANDTSDATCEYLVQSTYAWVMAVVAPDIDDSPSDIYLLDFDLEPQRCFGDPDETCRSLVNDSENGQALCDTRAALRGQSDDAIADIIGIRAGSIVTFSYDDMGQIFNTTDNGGSGFLEDTTYSVTTSFDQTYSIQTAAGASAILQLILLFCVLGGLSVLRRDAEVLVLGPLRRMLKIVARYAQNPLVQPRLGRLRSSRRKLSQRVISNDSISSTSSDSSDTVEGGRNSAWRNDSFALGSYETEQLIAAVTKITDLLRKCWGVAGADIISTNLATREGELTEVFNPTVPGKSVYALFAFAAINNFDHALRNLGGDVMILINDVAHVLHGEVFRWGFGDSGQCNKNLGGAFLLVFRIGLVKEVIKKLEQATDVVFAGTGSKSAQSKASQALTRRRANKQQQAAIGGFGSGQGARGSSSTMNSSGNSSTPSSTPSSGRTRTMNWRRSVKNSSHRSVSVKAMSLSLASLPGITTFTDRAVIGMLKAYASIHRDYKLRSWNNDIRLGYGVGAFTVSMIYGMDAGWAVEGAVGSEYKIDATYLSPHVNMASRMMSACKQYGVTILLSQAVQELMSDVARTKLRHLDTVTVKGSSVKQKIYTYDARHRGADFFLYSRSDEQADVDADRYTPNIWNLDQDLKAMRQHVNDDFLREFNEGRKMFLLGEWAVAQRRLEKANELMVENALDDGYLEDEFEEIQNQAVSPKEAAEELKKETGDGPSQYLLNFIKSHKGVCPKHWEGWHPLNRK